VNSDVELQGHTFEFVKLEKVNDLYLTQVAIDGKLYPSFYEPAQNCEGMKEVEFLNYLRAQSLGMKEYVETRV
jgi:hypothetical protein